MPLFFTRPNWKIKVRKRQALKIMCSDLMGGQKSRYFLSHWSAFYFRIFISLESGHYNKDHIPSMFQDGGTPNRC